MSEQFTNEEIFCCGMVCGMVLSYVIVRFAFYQVKSGNNHDH